MKKIIIEIIVILLLAFSISLTYNRMSSSGILLFPDKNTSGR